MPKPTNAVELVKKAAVEAVDASKPVHILFGTVISASPLKIQVDQKAIYTEKMLVLARNVTDYEVDMTVSHQTVTISHGHPVTDTYTGGGTAEDVDHNHPIKRAEEVQSPQRPCGWGSGGYGPNSKGQEILGAGSDCAEPGPEGGMGMIPQVQDDLKQDFTFTTLPSRTFKMRHDTKTITGTIDEVRAVEQAVFLILNVERYEC